MTESEETAAERWDRKYAREPQPAGTEPTAFLRQAMAHLDSRGRALDLAMGAGRNAVFLAECGFRVTGVDASEVGTSNARRLAEARGVEIDAVAADLATYPLGREEWDLITNFYFLDRRLFPRIVEALAPGGTFVLETFSTDHPRLASGYGPKNPDFLLEPNELLSAFADLRILLYQDLVMKLDEGHHRGPAGLIRLIARKPGSRLEVAKRPNSSES